MSSARTASGSPRAERTAEYARHGWAKTPTHNSWRGMIERCTREGHSQFKDYGGRGIRVDARWRRSFLAFLEDMGQRPPGMTLERRCNERGYGPDNCYWASRTTQARNKRNNRLITVGGVTRTAAEWAESAGIREHALLARIDRYGWDPAKAVSLPAGADSSWKRLLTIDGETLCLLDWARRVGLSDATIRTRLRRGWSPRDAVFSPNQQGRKLATPTSATLD